MLWRYSAWRWRFAGSFSASATPNNRSNTAHGRISGGFGVFSVRQEMLLL